MFSLIYFDTYMLLPVSAKKKKKKKMLFNVHDKLWGDDK